MSVNNTIYDFYYGNESEQFTFIKIPKIVLNEFDSLSIHAKMLYGILLDRMSLSQRTGWLDNKGRVYIYYKGSEIEKLLHCGHDKVSKIFRELEDAGLILRKRQGLGKPSMIFIKNFAREITEKSNCTVRKYSNQDIDIKDANNTDISNTEIIDESDAVEIIKNNISYEVLQEEYSTNYSMLFAINELVLIIEDVILGRRNVKIDGNIIPYNIVRERFMQLKYEHIKYVIESMANLKTDVKRIDNYVCTALYNATLTCNIADLKGFTAKTGVPLV